MKASILFLLLPFALLSQKSGELPNPRIHGMVKNGNMFKAEIVVSYSPGDSAYSYCFVNAEGTRRDDVKCAAFSRTNNTLDKFYNTLNYFFSAGNGGSGITKDIQLGDALFTCSSLTENGIKKVKVSWNGVASVAYTEKEVRELFGKK